MTGDTPNRPASTANPAVLMRLRRWLDIELISGGGFVVVGLMVPTGLLVLIVSLVALAFAPILVHALWTLGRRGWLAAFVCGALLPALLGLLSGDWFWRFVGIVTALVVFYGLCALLRAAVRQWQEDAAWQRAFEAGGLAIPTA